jgi:periplasmic mercuric ion binding protein
MKNILNSVKLIFAALIISSLTMNARAQEQKKEETITIKTSAVCGMCKERIENDMKFEKGVTEVSLNVKTKMLTVTYKTSKTNPEKLKIAVTKIGYDADELTADSKAYEKLPPCCKKGNETH